ncbi:PREDICTED: uncharacterized protein LOC104593828 isoform X2 [Nelumbo nucifera]|uniref:Uncharacterized protein LOC104593828 isoform X2 n=1 Tax=Nelumbo nucifera TaxID=4432 RepID=A0A1U7ZTC1_NELNU|nr:PREDICTED: uncharacterized protein LOC104593828 isoform X2 [Nelumbo nucifera]
MAAALLTWTSCPFPINLSPSSLVRQYNGCIWKGGRLRLEKAKEHYLVRLQREWAEAAELSSCVPNNNIDEDNNMGSSRKPKKLLTPEKMQLRIFFPRLQKVKSLPYGGTGKHKYSFQRVDVPSLPIHFCDCEEHLNASEITNGNRGTLEPESGVIGKEELNMMTLVMNKLFKREYNLNCTTENSVNRLGNGANSDQLVDDVAFNGSEADEETDVDNLVMNMVTSRNDGIGLTASRTKRTPLTELGSKVRQSQASKNEPTQKAFKPRKLKRKNGGHDDSDLTTNKKSHLLPEDESHQDDFASIRTEKKGHSRTYSEEAERLTEAQSVKLLESAFNKSAEEVNSETRSTEPGAVAENQSSKPNTQSTRGLSWVQKSSWRELVGEMGNSSFSISHILPAIPSIIQEPKKPDGMSTSHFTEIRHQSTVDQARNKYTGDSSKASGIGKDGIPKDKVTAPGGSSMMPSSEKEVTISSLEAVQSASEKNKQIVKDENNNTKTSEKKSNWIPKKRSLGEAGIAEFCTFMKSAVSEKEWMKTRAALSGSLKKNGQK